MGKKQHHQQQKRSPPPGKDTGKKLPAQKRHELDQLIDGLLKLGFKQTNNVTEQWAQYTEIQAILDRALLTKQVAQFNAQCILSKAA